MRILFVSNHETECCGVAEFGRQHVAALRGLGHEVETWHPRPDRHNWYRWHKLPAEGFDVVHVNYHPGTINYLQPPPSHPRLLTAFWHEPGISGNFGRVDAGFGAEPASNVNLVVPMPVVDYCPRGGYDRDDHRGNWLVGTSTLRGQGIPELRSVLDRRYFTVDAGGPTWLPTNQEIDRLRACDFLVFWYGGANRGQSAAVCMGIAAQRPIILSKNRMFDSLREFEDEFYFVDRLEEGIELVTWDLKLGTARLPRRARAARLWSVQAARMAAAWKGMLNEYEDSSR